jgi:membrane-associated protease RseP (regulator of RpoE activity)
MEYDPTRQYPQSYSSHGPEGERPPRTLQLFGFPLRIDPWFFVTAWLIGGRQEPQWMLVWVVVVVVGVLAHELGHAFAGRRLGMKPWIRLIAFGGMTGWSHPRRLTSGQQIFISAAGPAVGIAIGGAVLGAASAGLLSGASAGLLRVLDYVLWVNLGWGVLNLLPILPLDGGHIAASIATMAFGPKGRLGARGLSVVLTTAITLWALATGRWWLLVIGALLTFTNVQALRAETAVRPPM